MNADKIITEILAINKRLIDKLKLSDNNITALLRQHDLILQSILSQQTKLDSQNYKIELIDCGFNRIAVIKAIRTITGKSLKETDELTKLFGVIKENITLKEAESIKADLEAVGAKVKIVQVHS